MRSEKNTDLIREYVNHVAGHGDTFGLKEQLAYPRVADAFHQSRGILGAVGEIGVFLGDYLFAIGLCARPNEAIVAVDLFEDQTANFDGSGRHDKGFDHFRDIHGKWIKSGAPLKFLKGDSLNVTQADMLSASDGHRYRLLSIDGGHTHYHTVNDMLLAESVLCHGGVVILDDYTNAGWPGVAEGVGRYFLQTPRRTLAPFFLHWNKLLMTTESMHAELLEHFDSMVPDSQRHLAKRSRLYGFDVLIAQGFGLD